MYQIGDFIIYASTGVCRVEDILPPGGVRPTTALVPERTYYVLRPLYQPETIYSPVDNPKVFMRPIISAEEAQHLIDHIPALRIKADSGEEILEFKEQYQNAASSHDCNELMALILDIYTKKLLLTAQNRKFSQLDERYMKQAEDILYGELAAALDIEKDQVTTYIAERIGDL